MRTGEQGSITSYTVNDEVLSSHGFAFGKYNSLKFTSSYSVYSSQNVIAPIRC